MVCANNVFALFGLAGIFNSQRELVIAFFVYNIASLVVTFNVFIDLLGDLHVRCVCGWGLGASRQCTWELLVVGVVG
jgi:hypothetical protein